MTQTHSHSGTASNTTDCFRTFIGCTVKGLIIGGLPRGNMEISRGCHSLVFECGWAFTFSSHGTYWVESPDDVRFAVLEAKHNLEHTQMELKAILDLAGVEMRPQ